MWKCGQWGKERVPAEKDGTFEISGAQPGKYSLFAMSSDQKRFSKKIEVLVPHVGGPKDIELRLVEGGRVKFMVGTPDGKPVPGVNVFHLGDDGKREELFRKFTGALGIWSTKQKQAFLKDAGTVAVASVHIHSPN